MENRYARKQVAETRAARLVAQGKLPVILYDADVNAWIVRWDGQPVVDTSPVFGALMEPAEIQEQLIDWEEGRAPFPTHLDDGRTANEHLIRTEMDDTPVRAAIRMSKRELEELEREEARSK